MRVGRIAGFELRIHWSTLFVFGLLVWTLAAVLLPDQAPESGTVGHVTAAVVAGLAFYAALLAHEFSHAVVARREGIEVESLTLWLLGGVASLRGEAETPGAAGEVFGYLLVGLGLLSLMYPGFGGLWFLVLGWFLINAARAEQAQTVLLDTLGDVRIESVMTRDPVTAPADATVAELLEDYVMRTRHSAFPLRDPAGRPAGLVTLGRLRDVPGACRHAVRVFEVACPMGEVVTAAPTDRLVDLLPRLNACGDGRALVVDGGDIVGLVTPADVTRAVEIAGLGRRDAGRVTPW